MTLVFPVDEQQDELLQAVCLHVVVVDDIEAEVEQALVLAGLRLQHGADVQFQFVENLLVDVTIGVDEVAEQLVVLDCL